MKQQNRTVHVPVSTVPKSKKLRTKQQKELEKERRLLEVWSSVFSFLGGLFLGFILALICVYIRMH